MQQIARQLGELLFVFCFLILIRLLSVEQHPWDVEKNEDLLSFYQRLESVQDEWPWPIPPSTFSDSFDLRAWQLNFRNPRGWKIDYLLWTVPFLSWKYRVGFATSFFLFSISPCGWSFEFPGFHSSSPVTFCSLTSDYKQSLQFHWTHSINSCQTSRVSKSSPWNRKKPEPDRDWNWFLRTVSVRFCLMAIVRGSGFSYFKVNRGLKKTGSKPVPVSFIVRYSSL